MEAAILGFDLVPNYVVLDLGNEGGGPHHMEALHTKGPWDRFKEASGCDFEISSNFQLRLKKKFLQADIHDPRCSTKHPF